MEVSPNDVPVKPIRGRPPLPEVERIARVEVRRIVKRDARRRLVAANPATRPVGRPRLPSAERRSRLRASKDKWKEANMEKYLAKKAECRCRPEYKAHRRANYVIRVRITLEQDQGGKDDESMEMTV
jgi:hypothetical protein